MDSYLRSIKTVADALVAVQSPISDLELILFSTGGLFDDYDSFITTFPMLSGSILFDDLRPKLLFYKQCLICKKDCSQSIHQAFVTTIDDAQGHRDASSNCLKVIIKEIATTATMVKTTKTTKVLHHSLLKQNQHPPRGPTGIIICNAVDSLFGIICSHTSLLITFL